MGHYGIKGAAAVTAASIISLLLFLPVIALILPLWLFVFLCGRLNSGVFARVSQWGQIVQYDPRIGWKPRSNLRKVRYHDPVADVGIIDTDESGWPLTLGIAESQVVVFGDSFAFGFGTKMKDAYHSSGQGLRIKPVASPGFNMVQALMLMKQYREDLSGKMVFWFVCLENDLVENLKPYNSKNYPTPYIRNGRSGGWEIETGHLQAKQWPYRQIASNTVSFANACTRCAYSERVYSGARYLVSEARRICDSAGARLVVLTVPDKRQLSEAGIKSLKQRLPDDAGFSEDFPDQRFREICGALNVPFFAGKEHLSVDDYKPRDPHWNRKGNRKINRIVEERYMTAFPEWRSAPRRLDPGRRGEMRGAHGVPGRGSGTR